MNDSLPKTAYVKMLDIWMLAAMLLPFFEIIALVLRKEVSCIRRSNGRFQFSKTPSDSELSVVRTEFLTGTQRGKLFRQTFWT